MKNYLSKDYQARLALMLAKLPLEKRLKAFRFYADSAERERQLVRLTEEN